MKVSTSNSSVVFHLPAFLSKWGIEAVGNQITVAARLLSDCEELGISSDSSTVELPNQTVAAWPESIAIAAGLPKNTPFGFDLRLSSGLGMKGTKLSVRWLKPSTTLPLSQSPEIDGIVIRLGGHSFRIQEPYFSVLALVQFFNDVGLDNPQEQFRVWASIRSLLGEKVTANVTDSFLRVFRVTTADSFTLSFDTDENGDLQINPVLMTSSVNFDDGKSTKVRALTEKDDATLTSRLDSLADGASAFPLADGSYVVVNERLQNALKAIKSLRKATPQERKRAVLHPEAVIAELIGEDADLTTNDPIFFETETYSERVLDVAEWIPPIVPWIKVQSQQWLPTDTFGYRIGNTEIPLTVASLDAAVQSVEQAIAAGSKTATVQEATVPATDETLTSLKQLQEAVSARINTGGSEGKSLKPTPKVLVIQTNFDHSDYVNTSSSSRLGAQSLPYCLKTEPKTHQVDGINWLQSHWISGSTGALLADDMGLGKTFQALAFLAWIKELMDNGVIAKRPILIVAPVGLLKNWEAEHDMHLASPGLGDVVRAYGDHLKFIKSGSHRSGNAGLDTTQLANADWVLANYEAVSDYQLSFGAIKFACVVFDEAQKIKTPSARMTHAAKGLNTEFVLAMTGTPVENRLADLWCIADTVQPMALGILKDFSIKYETESAQDSVKKLRDLIWQEESQISQSTPQLMLRRLKTEKLSGLPKKYEHFVRQDMPRDQVQAYRHAVAMKEVKGPQGTLGTIQALRSVSLHPGLYTNSSSEFDPSKSARFKVALDILDECFKVGEKVLVFLESLELQSPEQFPLFLQRRYDLAHLPLVINGDVKTHIRQNRVDEFQQRGGFDVMILSPKAGGVGITLTAANHVIHLSRWWNPAVEDQCSDRAYRIGQTKDVHIYYPLAINPEDPESSFDLKLNELMHRKRILSQQLLAPPTFTKEDYESILSSVR
jgi:hypothetical protein